MFTVEFETANSAFNEESLDFGNDEVARIMGVISSQVRENRYGVNMNNPIRDSNGSRIGSWRYQR